MKTLPYFVLDAIKFSELPIGSFFSVYAYGQHHLCLKKAARKVSALNGLGLEPTLLRIEPETVVHPVSLSEAIEVQPVEYESPTVDVEPLHEGEYPQQ